MATDHEVETFVRVLRNAAPTVAQMTPREQAEAAWSPTSRHSVDELEDLIRADRGLPPVHAQAS